MGEIVPVLRLDRAAAVPEVAMADVMGSASAARRHARFRWPRSPAGQAVSRSYRERAARSADEDEAWVRRHARRQVRETDSAAIPRSCVHAPPTRNDRRRK